MNGIRGEIPSTMAAILDGIFRLPFIGQWAYECFCPRTESEGTEVIVSQSPHSYFNPWPTSVQIISDLSQCYNDGLRIWNQFTLNSWNYLNDNNSSFLLNMIPYIFYCQLLFLFYYCSLGLLLRVALVDDESNELISIQSRMKGKKKFPCFA